ncbi:uncharacterized protein [Trachinotus anak]|uniref:uncharacterized protein isoform X2 n=1 Tax=Trachinotus anak TaxID=443729 RepID=UPI0039F1C8F7
MTSWRNFISLFLLVFLLTDLSKAHCGEYLTKEGMAKSNLTVLLPLAKGNDSMTVILCTLELDCSTTKRRETCSLLNHCFGNKNAKCDGPSHQNISVYNLKCLIAKEMNLNTYEGCKYENICRLYSEITSNQHDQTRSPPAATTRALPPKTTPSTTRANRETAPPETSTARSLTTTATVVSSIVTNPAASKQEKALINMMSLLILSMTLNVVLPLAVYLCMRRRTQGQTQIYGPGIDPRAQPMTESQLNMGHGNEVETTQLMQSTECLSVFTPAADTTGDGCTIGNGVPT